MPVAEHASGSQALTVGTEHFVGTDPEASDGALQLVVDLSPMVSGATPDEIEIRVYEAALSSDTASQLVHTWSFKGAQVDDLFMSPVLMFLHRWRVSIKQVAGTGRTVKWSIRKAT